jgi:hypothetical protein
MVTGFAFRDTNLIDSETQKTAAELEIVTEKFREFTLVRNLPRDDEPPLRNVRSGTPPLKGGPFPRPTLTMANPLYDARWTIWEAQSKKPSAGVLDDAAGDEFKIWLDLDWDPPSTNKFGRGHTTAPRHGPKGREEWYLPWGQPWDTRSDEGRTFAQGKDFSVSYIYDRTTRLRHEAEVAKGEERRRKF